MSILGTLSNPGVGNLILLGTAMVGVGGSYALYRKRISDKRQAARMALKGEIESIVPLNTWEDKEKYSPIFQNIQSRVVFDSQAEHLGLLTEEEIRHLTLLNSKLSHLNAMLDIHIRTGFERVQLADDDTSTGVIQEMDRAVKYRWQCIQVLNKHLNNDHIPTDLIYNPKDDDDVVHCSNPLIERYGDEMERKEYIERVGEENEIIRLTKEGSQWLGENQDIAGAVSNEEENYLAR